MVGKTANLVMIRAQGGFTPPYCLMNEMIWGLGFWLNEVLFTRLVARWLLCLRWLDHNWILTYNELRATGLKL